MPTDQPSACKLPADLIDVVAVDAEAARDVIVIERKADVAEEVLDLVAATHEDLQLLPERQLAELLGDRLAR